MCQSVEDYGGFDGELGLCVCREPPGRAACNGLCRRKPATELVLQCHSDGFMELVWSYDAQVNGGNGFAHVLKGYAEKKHVINFYFRLNKKTSKNHMHP